MAFCSNCGKKAEDGVRFCSGCGKALDGAPGGNVSSQSGSNGAEETKGNFSLNTIKSNIIAVDAVLAVIGIGLMMYGSSQNNNIGTQLSSFLGRGRTNPGTSWIIFGGILLCAGAVLIIKKLIDNNKQ